MRVPKPLQSLLVAAQLPRTSFIFILAPMRSGSTVLQHLIAQAPGVLSAGETHVVYRSPADLRQLMQKVYRYNNHLGLRPSRILEKCVTDELVEDLELGNYPRLRLVFLLRDPVATVASLAALPKWEHGGDAATAAAYLLRRFMQLEQLATRLRDPSRGFLLTYDDLLDRTGETLAALSQFLALPEPLREAYAVQRWTGALARGDRSENIHRGVLVREERRREVAVPAGLRADLERAYARTLATLAGRMGGMSPRPADPAMAGTVAPELTPGEA